MTCADLLVQVAEAALDSQLPDGSMPGGQNGPYGDPETSLRNSGHWMYTFLKAYALTGEGRFEEAAHRISRVLLQPHFRPGGYTFHHRTNPGKDHCNGLVGQAWTIESLVLASLHFRTVEHVALALEVFRQHSFDRYRGLWQIREIDGSSPGFDKTLNHQLWFAAAASRLLHLDAPDLSRALDIFLERLPQNMMLFRDGLIYHDSILQVESTRRRLATIPTRVIGSGLFPKSLLGRPTLANGTALYMKGVGYHAFCAHAFATLKLQLPSHAFWQSSSAHRVVRYLLSPEYSWVVGIEKHYGFSYNAPGFEVPFAVSTLLGMTAAETAPLVSTWVTAQALRTFNPQSVRFDKGTPDPATLTARIYEMSGLPDDVLRAAVLGTLSS